MKCPYCNKEMKKGFLRSGKHFHWGPEKDMYVHPENFRLSEGEGFLGLNGCFAESHYCEKCKILITPVDK